LTEAIQQRLNVTIRQGYGMTEASPVTHYGHHRFTPRAGTVNTLIPSTQGRLVEVDSGRDAAAGQPGEVWIRGPQVMKGYLNNAEATARTLDAEGWLHTGDIGVMDADGYLTIVDRLKELIKVKGYQVAPAELEALLLKHPRIADAAVIPVPDDECGEVPKAIVVARGELTADEVIAFVHAQVAHYKRIRYVGFTDAIPKSASGKILRRVLVERERNACAES
jgi:acyl-CoA synthetase (AMP-forming)/AMP-acid ligase II